MARRRYKYDFVQQEHSARGRISVLFGGISLGLLIAASVCSLALHGKGGMYLGAMGLSGICLSVYGFVLGLKSFSDKNRNLFFCKVGAVGNGILMVMWLSLFLIGI